MAMDAKLLRYLTQHPLNRRSPLRHIPGMLLWAVATRLLGGRDVIMPFANDSRLIVTPGRWGSEANALCGLHDYADMGFLLHLLRPGDLFCDIGANIGAYTVLASAARGARSIAYEPTPRSFGDLRANIVVNGVDTLAEPRNAGVGGEAGRLNFSLTQDTMNHVVLDADDGNLQSVEVVTLDDDLGGETPTLMKIDVEGWEHEVLRGAPRKLASPTLLALIVELNGSGENYGFSDDATHRRLTDTGFSPHRYWPNTRELTNLNGRFNRRGNTIYVRDVEQVLARVRSAPPFRIRDLSI
jgi:FkbM family methyltransferase